MPDWRQYVRERIGRLGLDAAREEEIVSELASHLEDCYEESLRLATSEQEAVVRAKQEVSDWGALAEAIRLAQSEEENMNNRTKHLWLPGLATLTLSMLLLMILIRSGIQPLVVALQPPHSLLLYLPWLVALPALGGAGTYWSRRAGGGQQAGIAAGLFSAWAMGALFLAMWPLAFFIDRHVPAGAKLYSLALSLLNWGVIPAAALLVGVLPFLKGSRLSPRVKTES